MAILQELHEELLVEILCWLPVQSLLRSKSVCKYWYSLLQTPSFIYLHHHRAASVAAASNTDRLLVNRFLQHDQTPYNRGAVLSFVLDQTPVEDIDMSSFGLDTIDLRIWGPCNGVVCLTIYAINSPIVIWNPSMKEVRVLPQPSCKTYLLSNLGFGYDPYADDYKVVRFDVASKPTPIGDVYGPVEIYELRTDSWREVDAETPIKSNHCLFDTYVSWNGDCFWYHHYHYQRGGPVIMAFSMSDEVFDEVPVPEVCLVDRQSEQKLFILKNNLAMVIYPTWQSHPSMFPHEQYALVKSFAIWVMNEDDVEVSWTKKFTIGPLVGLNWPLGFRQNGEFLLESGYGQMMSYNLNTQERKEYEVHDQVRVYPLPPHLQVIPYTESLVTVKRQQ